jgi:hypothetical protein
VVCVYGIGAVSMAAWYGGHEVRPRPATDDPPPEPEPESQSVPAPADAPVT